uniref:Uncharacterized protein n=1 Tax=Anguilla anguilla TaxID=7936 RepID=A0A0E9RBB1_ANGAN
MLSGTGNAPSGGVMSVTVHADLVKKKNNWENSRKTEPVKLNSFHNKICRESDLNTMDLLIAMEFLAGIFFFY